MKSDQFKRSDLAKYNTVVTDGENECTDNADQESLCKDGPHSTNSFVKMEQSISTFKKIVLVCLPIAAVIGVLNLTSSIMVFRSSGPDATDRFPDATDKPNVGGNIARFGLTVNSTSLYDAFVSTINTHLKNGTLVLSPEEVTYNVASQFSLSETDLESIESTILSENQIYDLSSIFEDGNETFAWSSKMHPLRNYAYSSDDISDMLNKIEIMALNGSSPDDVVNHLTVNGYSLDALETIFEEFKIEDGGRTKAMIINEFEAVQEAQYNHLLDVMTHSDDVDEISIEENNEEAFFNFSGMNRTKHLRKRIHNKRRFLLQDKFRSSKVNYEEEIAAVHHEIEAREASRNHHRYLSSVRDFHTRLNSYFEDTSNRLRYLQSLCESGDSGFTRASTEFVEANELITSKYEEAADKLGDMESTISSFGDLAENADTSYKGLSLVLPALKIAEMIPYVGKAFTPMKIMIEQAKNGIGSVDKAFTKIDKVMAKIEKGINTTLHAINKFDSILDTAPKLTEMVGTFVEGQCNAEFISQLSGVNLLDLEGSIVDASDATLVFVKALVSGLDKISDIASGDIWKGINEVISLATGFVTFVEALYKPFEFLGNLVNKEVKIPWIGEIYKKRNLGPAKCRTDVGYSSKPGEFGNECWEVCANDEENLMLVPPKCRPRCSRLHRKSEMVVGGCQNIIEKQYTRSERKGKRKHCKSNENHVPVVFGKDKCRKKCLANEFKPPFNPKICQRYSQCSAKGFSPGISGNDRSKLCVRPAARKKKKHSATCDRYVPKDHRGRLTFKTKKNILTGACMKQCDSGHGETPVGLCIKPGELIFKISDITDALGNIMDEAGGFILDLIEKGITFVVEKVLNPILKTMGLKPINVPKFSNIGEIPGIDIPTLPELAILDKFTNIVSNISKVPEAIEEKIIDLMPSLDTLKIPEAFEVLSSSISSIIDSGEDIVDAFASFVSGITCETVEMVEGPSLVTVFKELGIAPEWNDCKIGIPICKKFSIPNLSEKIDALEVATSKTDIAHRRVESTESVGKQPAWINLPSIKIPYLSTALFDIDSKHMGQWLSIKGEVNFVFEPWISMKGKWCDEDEDETGKWKINFKAILSLDVERTKDLMKIVSKLQKDCKDLLKILYWFEGDCDGKLIGPLKEASNNELMGCTEKLYNKYKKTGTKKDRQQVDSCIEKMQYIIKEVKQYIGITTFYDDFKSKFNHGPKFNRDPLEKQVLPNTWTVLLQPPKELESCDIDPKKPEISSKSGVGVSINLPKTPPDTFPPRVEELLKVFNTLGPFFDYAAKEWKAVVQYDFYNGEFKGVQVGTLQLPWKKDDQGDRFQKAPRELVIKSIFVPMVVVVPVHPSM